MQLVRNLGILGSVLSSSAARASSSGARLSTRSFRRQVLCLSLPHCWLLLFRFWLGHSQICLRVTCKTRIQERCPWRSWFFFFLEPLCCILWPMAAYLWNLLIVPEFILNFSIESVLLSSYTEFWKWVKWNQHILCLFQSKLLFALRLEKEQGRIFT